MATLARILAIWRVYAYLDLMFIARGLRTAVTYYTSDLVIGMSAVTATFLLAERFDGIGVWSKGQILFMLGYALFVRGLMDTFFGFNIAFISRRIGRGQLDHTLIQPVPLWMAVLTEGFIPFTGSGMLIPAFGLVVWSGAQLGIEPTPAWLGLFALNLAGSVGVFLGFMYLWGSLAFWAPRAAEEVNSSTNRMISQIKQFPLDGLSGAGSFALMTIVPVGFVAWYPCRALLGLGGSPLATPFAGLVAAALAAAVFARGMKHYGRTGSSRYLSWGFRR